MSLTDLFDVNTVIHSTIIKLSAHVFKSLDGLTFISKLCYDDNGFFLSTIYLVSSSTCFVCVKCVSH